MPTTESDYLNCVEALRENFSTRPFQFGFGGYDPFILSNGQIEGPMYEAMIGIAKELNTAVHPIPISWQNFSKMLRDMKIYTVAEPIISSMSRPLNIIPYVSFISNVVLYHLRFENTIKQHIESISHLWQKLFKTNKTEDKHKILNMIRTRLYQIDDIGEGFAVTRGVVDQDNLRYFNVTHRTFDNPDIIDNAKLALKGNHIMLLDFPSAQKLLDEFSDSDIYNYNWAHLFGENYPIKSFAGFAFHPINENLQRFFMYHCKREDGIIRSSINTIDSVKLNNYKIEIIPHEKIPEYPLSLGFSFNQLLQAGPTTELDPTSLSISDLETIDKPLYNNALDLPYMNKQFFKASKFLRLVSSIISVGIMILLFTLIIWYGRDLLGVSFDKAKFIIWIGSGIGIEIVIIGILMNILIKGRLRNGN